MNKKQKRRFEELVNEIDHKIYVNISEFRNFIFLSEDNDDKFLSFYYYLKFFILSDKKCKDNELKKLISDVLAKDSNYTLTGMIIIYINQDHSNLLKFLKLDYIDFKNANTELIDQFVSDVEKIKELKKLKKSKSKNDFPADFWVVEAKKFTLPYSVFNFMLSLEIDKAASHSIVKYLFELFVGKKFGPWELKDFKYWVSISKGHASLDSDLSDEIDEYLKLVS